MQKMRRSERASYGRISRVVCTNVDQSWSRIIESWIKQTINIKSQ